MDTKGAFLIPRTFSPLRNTQILCTGGIDSIGHGIINLENKAYRILKTLETSAGEDAFLFLDVIDWVDWRKI